MHAFNIEILRHWMHAFDILKIFAFDIESIGRNLDTFLRWRNAVLQMLETWLLKERLLSNSTPRFLTDDEEFTEQPSSVRQCSSLLHAEVLSPIINTSVFCFFSSEISSKKLLIIQFFISTMHSVSFSNWYVLPGQEVNRAEYHQHNSES